MKHKELWRKMSKKCWDCYNETRIPQNAAQSAESAKYADCISAGGAKLPPPDESPGYDIKLHPMARLQSWILGNV